MKKIFLIFLCLFSTGIKGQVEPSVTYDPTTGNYIIQYEGYEGENQQPTLVNLIYEPTNKITPLVYFRTVFNSDSNFFSYQYTIENTSSSLQRLQDFDIEIFASIFEISSPDEFWKTGYYSFAPVFGWFNSIGAGGLSDPLNGIAPDSSETGFSFNSTGYPAISNAYLRGKPEIYLAFPDEPPDEIEALLKPLEKFPNDCVIIKTISPKDPPSPFIPSEFLDPLINYNTQSYELGWITNESTRNKYENYFSGARNALENSDTSFARTYLKNVLIDVDIDSSSALTSEAYALLRYNTEYLLEQIPEPQLTEPVVKLLNSAGAPLLMGICQYYEGGWKTAADNNDGTFAIETDKTTLSIRMTYANGMQTLSNVPWGTGPVVFQTVNTQVELKDSEDNYIDQGTVKYYAGGWRDFGTTESGIASKELLPINYSFRMTYAFSSNDKQQNLSDNETVVFQTVPAIVQLKDSENNFIDEGAVKYYAGGWRDFGVTSNGVVVKELLPNNYSFRMTYAFGSNDKQQNLNENTTVLFQTVPATVQLKNSQGNLIDQGIIQYYSGGWRSFGTTTNGEVVKELLPNNYSFRMTYAFASKDQQQNLNDNITVVFETVPATVQLINSESDYIDEGTVKYYSGGWRDFGVTTNGIVVKELLPNNYSFRMTYAFASNDKQQNIGTDPNVIFQTVPATVQLQNSQGELIDEGIIKYYSGGWRDFGTTTNGVIVKELLPKNYSFRMVHEFISNDKAQNLSENNVVLFSTVNCIVRVNDQFANYLDGALVSYYSGGWRQIGTTVSGEITKELLPKSLNFRASYDGTTENKTQDTSTNNIVEFTITE